MTSSITDDDPCDLCDGTGRRWIVHIKNLDPTCEEPVEIDLGPCCACGGSGIIEGGRWPAANNPARTAGQSRAPTIGQAGAYQPRRAE
jgi:hypothetical protein